MAKFFTSDTHFGDDRFDLFYRPFKSVQEQTDYLIQKWNEIVKPNDTVYHLGDFSTTEQDLKVFEALNGRIIMIKGNYDTYPDEDYLKYVHEIHESLDIKIGTEKVHLNHYPNKAVDHMFNLVGHIHGLWKVQRNMINVSTDAWHFTPIPEKTIKFAMTAIRKYYDDNVFAGEVTANLNYLNRQLVYAEEEVKDIDGHIVFLAGPTPRTQKVKSWRPKMIQALRDEGYEGTILIPEKRVGDEYDFEEQVEWEEEALEKAHQIIFWVPRDLKTMPAFTTNVEFGEWMRSGKIVLGFPSDAANMRYLAKKAAKYNIPQFGGITALANYVAHPTNNEPGSVKNYE